MRAATPALLALAARLAVADRASAESATERAARGDSLYRYAMQQLAHNTIDARRVALRALEQATLVVPDNPAYELVLARTYYQAGFLKSARVRFERVARLAPTDASSRFGLGQVWRRDWLKYLDRGSLARAVEHLSVAARLDPTVCDSWLLLSPLLIEQGHLKAAAAAAERALEADPERPEAQIAVASARYRLGDVALADSLFHHAIPRLRRSVRAHFDDISPVATEEDTTILHHLPVMRQIDFIRRFWKEHDPDPTTLENEVQVEYWSRVAQATFLFYDARRRDWDERGEVYVRYGPPDSAAYNPLWSPDPTRYDAGRNPGRVVFGQYGVFPANVLVWHYPALGMTVTLQDRLLSEHYLLPIDVLRDPDPRPDPDSLARRDDALAVRGGRGVFPLLPPGARRLPVAGALARFEGADGPRLVGELEVPAGPGDSLWAEWAILDSAAFEVTRARRTLSPSPCDPAQHRSADFAAALAPGRYHVGVSVRGPGRVRGLYREDIELHPPDPALALSDVVISCGAPEVGGTSVRLAANPEARVVGSEPLTAYFEIYHLRPGATGTARFEYVYTVRSTEKDTRFWIQRALVPRRTPPPISASRAEENPGALRRQFVTVPVQSLPTGHYQLEIRVRDLVAGTEAVGAAPFVRLASVSVPGGP